MDAVDAPPKILIIKIILIVSGFRMKKKIPKVPIIIIQITIVSGFKMKKRVGDVEEFEFEDLTMGNSLHITIAISGWLSKDITSFTGPWAELYHSREQVRVNPFCRFLVKDHIILN